MSVECPLNHNAHILVQTAHCRFLCNFTPLIFSLSVPSPLSAPIPHFLLLPLSLTFLPLSLFSLYLTYPLFLRIPPFPLRFLNSFTLDFNILLLDYPYSSSISHPHSFSFLPPPPLISSQFLCFSLSNSIDYTLTNIMQSTAMKLISFSLRSSS